MIKLYGKPIRVNKSSQDKRSQDVGANLFIGNLDPDVDEKVDSPLLPAVDQGSHYHPGFLSDFHEQSCFSLDAMWLGLSPLIRIVSSPVCALSHSF